jgi:hypothetical protein
MKNLSQFDMTMIVVFVIVSLLGGGGAYYLATYQLAPAQQEIQTIDNEFKTYTDRMIFLPTQKNVKVLQGNIDMIKSQLDPLIQNNLQAPGNTLGTIHNENTVDWKHKLDLEVAKLNAAAKVQGVQLPSDNYYYSFARYLSQAPSEPKTGVLSKQLLAVETMTNIIIGAQVNALKAIRRTAEEDDHAYVQQGAPGSGDLLTGHSIDIGGGIYTAYPFEIEFDATTDAIRKIINDLTQSPYVFVIRSVTVSNQTTGSPQLGDLDKIAGVQQSTSVTDSPGVVAATKSRAGPQYLFGNEILHVQIRVDFIEWKGLPAAATSSDGKPTKGT